MSSNTGKSNHSGVEPTITVYATCAQPAMQRLVHVAIDRAIHSLRGDVLVSEVYAAVVKSTPRPFYSGWHRTRWEQEIKERLDVHGFEPYKHVPGMWQQPLQGGDA